MNIRLMFFLMFNVLCLSSQEYLEGKVLSQDSVEIPFCRISFNNFDNVVVSGPKGAYRLEIPDTFSSRDSVLFQSLGYMDKSIALIDLVSHEGVVCLKAASSRLNDVNIKVGSDKSKWKNKKYGSKKKKPDGTFNLAFGHEVGLIIKPGLNESAYINKVGFYVMEDGYPETPFRIHVYSLDSLTNGPGREILNANIIAKGDKRGGWVYVNLADYLLRLPKNGVFVSMEWLPVSKGKEYKLDYYNFSKPQGQILGGTREFDSNALTWSRHNSGNWVKHYFPGSNSVLNAKIVVVLRIKRSGFTSFIKF